MKTKKNLFKLLKQTTLILLMIPMLMACASSISNYSVEAYKQTTSLKVDALNIMDLSTEAYPLHKAEVEEFEIKVQKVYEFEKNRPQNELTIKLWDKLLDENGALLGGFIQKWKTKEKGVFGNAFIKHAKISVGDAFDIISSLESKKIKPSEVKQ